jgi:hypothetical protein
MSWKDWPYWLKGGMVGILVLIVLVFLWGSVFAIMNNGKCGVWDSPSSFGLCYGVPYMALTLPAFYVGNIAARAFYSQTDVGEPIPTVLSSLVGSIFFIGGGVLLWFLVGAIVGLIIGKVKKQ